MTTEQQPERDLPYSEEEEEDYVLLEHEESDENEEEKEENSEDENDEQEDDVLEDDDEDLLQGSSNRRRNTAQCLVLLMASAYVLSLCAMLAPTSSLVVQEEEELPLSGPPRSWFLVLKPRVSGTILGTSKWFGDYNLDDYTTDDNELSLTDPIRDKAIELAGVWMHREARTIFDTIANFHFHYDPDDSENYHRDRVRFTQLHKRSGKHEYAFEFREVEANTIRRPFLRTLQHEVRVGGDTWACGDFGDVTMATRGMQAEWSRIFGDNDVMRSLELRVSLADDDAYILDQDGKLIPEKPTQCLGNTLHYNTANERLRMGWFYY